MKTFPKLAVLTIVCSGSLAALSSQKANAARRFVRKQRVRTVVVRTVRPRRLGFVSPGIPFRYRFGPAYGWGYRNGIADIIRARGQATLLRSGAAINYQEAYRRSLENRLFRLQVLRERRRLGTLDRKAYYAKKRKSLARYLAAKRAETAKRLAAKRAGKKGEVNEASPDSGADCEP